jgi:zinc protease
MSVMERTLKRVLYKDKNYGWSFDDAIELIKNLKQVDLLKLHMQFITPSNMIFALSGNFDLDTMESIVRRVFGQWPAGVAKKIALPRTQFTPKERVDTFMLRDQAVLVLCQPSPLSIYDPDLVPMKLLNIIAFKSLGSRLYQLREKTGMFYAAFGSFAAGASREPGFDYVGALLSVDKLNEAETKIRILTKELAEKGITEQELAGAKQIYLKALIDGASTINAISNTLTFLDSLGLGFDYYDKVLKQIQSMTVDDMNKFAAQYTMNDDMACIRIGRIPTAQPAQQPEKHSGHSVPNKKEG